MNIDRDKKKAEAVARMKLLELYAPTIRQFEKQDLVSIIEPPVGAFFWVEGDELEEMRRWEQEHNALVYAICPQLHVARTDGLVSLRQRPRERVGGRPRPSDAWREFGEEG